MQEHLVKLIENESIIDKRVNINKFKYLRPSFFVFIEQRYKENYYYLRKLQSDKVTHT